MSLVSGEKSNFQFVSHPLQYYNAEIEFNTVAAALECALATRLALGAPKSILTSKCIRQIC